MKMNAQHVFPTQSIAEGLGEPAIQLEGQKVVFDKKVSLLPTDVKNRKPSEGNEKHGKS